MTSITTLYVPVINVGWKIFPNVSYWFSVWDTIDCFAHWFSSFIQPHNIIVRLSHTTTQEMMVPYQLMWWQYSLCGSDMYVIDTLWCSMTSHPLKVDMSITPNHRPVTTCIQSVHICHYSCFNLTSEWASTCYRFSGIIWKPLVWQFLNLPGIVLTTSRHMHKYLNHTLSLVEVQILMFGSQPWLSTACVGEKGVFSDDGWLICQLAFVHG